MVSHSTGGVRRQMTTSPQTTVGSPPLIEPGDEAKRGRLHLVARHFVDSGRVVPTVVLDVEGTARSQWVPLPATSDRPLVAALLDEDTPEDHLRVARLLADEVDRLTRARLHGSGCSLVARRKGRRSVPQAWLESLSSLDPALPDSLALDKVAAFSEAVGDWVASGAATRGRARLCLRVHEPGSHSDAPVTDPVGDETGSESCWWVELLIQDAEEPSLMVPIADLWAGAAPFPVGSVEEVLRSLARTVSVAPELAEVLDHGAPTGLALDTDQLLGFVELRSEPLAEIGVAVLLPSWWRKRSRVTLRARASSPSSGSKGVVVAAGLDFDQLVSFKLEAALGDRRLTKADLAQLQRAAASKRQLVQLRGEWVQLDPDELHGIIERVGHKGRSTVAELVRSSLGLSGLAAIDGEQVRTGGASGEPATGTHRGAPPVAVVASGWLGRLLGEVHTASVRPQPTPDSFNGALRPYQERGVGWLTFLGRLNLGACLPTTWASARPPS
jgi:hypothetical protein